MRSPESGNPESFRGLPDFDPNAGLPKTERPATCTICFQPNCTDPSHRPEGARETEPIDTFETLLEADGVYEWRNTDEHVYIKKGSDVSWQWRPSNPLIDAEQNRETTHSEKEGMQTIDGRNLQWPTLGINGCIAAWDIESKAIVIFETDGSTKELQTVRKGTDQVSVPEYTKSNELLITERENMSFTMGFGACHKYNFESSNVTKTAPGCLDGFKYKIDLQGKMRMAKDGSLVLSQAADGKGKIRVIAPDNTVRVFEDLSEDKGEYSQATLLPNGEVVTFYDDGDSRNLTRITPDGNVLECDEWVDRDAGYTSLAVFPNGRIMVVPSDGNRKTRVYDPDGKRYTVRSPDSSVIIYASTSPNGDVLLMTAQETIYVFSKQQKERAEEEVAKNQPPIARKF